MNWNEKFVVPFLAISAFGVLTSCAVLTIDVDVYKGPLANHTRVQTAQVAAMAIGAKPLLLELRDKLEWPDLDTLDQYPPWWRPDFIPPPDKPAGNVDSSWFKKKQAVRVNAILSLYEDRVLDDLSYYASQFDALFTVYKQAKKI